MAGVSHTRSLFIDYETVERAPQRCWHFGRTNAGERKCMSKLEYQGNIESLGKLKSTSKLESTAKLESTSSY